MPRMPRRRVAAQLEALTKRLNFDGRGIAGWRQCAACTLNSVRNGLEHLPNFAGLPAVAYVVAIFW
jgi:hypothetical protein